MKSDCIFTYLLTSTGCNWLRSSWTGVC